MIKDGENGKGIGSRWYAETIVRRIWDIQTVRHKIIFLQQDGIGYIDQEKEDPENVFFIDPPYWVAGSRLYDCSELDHHHLFQVTGQVRGDFLMTYDNAEEIRAYAAEQGFQTRLISMHNKNHATQKELLISRDFGWLAP